MSTEKTDALVIRLADFSETSRVVTFFTREFGKVSALAKGARRLKSSFEAALDLLTACRIVFLRKSSASLDILTEAQLISRFRPAGRNLTGLYGGYYVAELLSGLTEDYDPHPVLYDESVQALSRLSHDDDPRLSLLRFELVLLREIGQLPAFDVCVNCGAPATEKKPYGFWVSQGGVICPQCRNEEFDRNVIQPGTLAVLRRLAADSRVSVDRLQVSPAQYGEMRRVMTTAVTHVLGRRPRMQRYLDLEMRSQG